MLSIPNLGKIIVIFSNFFTLKYFKYSTTCVNLQYYSNTLCIATWCFEYFVRIVFEKNFKHFSKVFFFLQHFGYNILQLFGNLYEQFGWSHAAADADRKRLLIAHPDPNSVSDDALQSGKKHSSTLWKHDLITPFRRTNGNSVVIIQIYLQLYNNNIITIKTGIVLPKLFWDVYLK